MTRILTVAVLFAYVLVLPRVPFENIFLTTANFNPGAHAPPVSLLRYRALCNGTGTVPVGPVLVLDYRVADFVHHLCSPPTPPDAIQLGHAKVVLDNSVASGSVSRNGTFVMCGSVVALYWTPRLADGPPQPRRRRRDIRPLRGISRSCL